MAQWSDPSSVQQLLTAGADTSLLNNQGSTPLIKLAYQMSGICLDDHHLDGRGTNPRLETFTLVLQNTVDVNAQNTAGDNALHALATGRLSGVMGRGRIEAAKLLFGTRGVDLAKKNLEGKTAGELFAENDVEGLVQGNAELTRLLPRS